jgi:hypothetical protein
VFGVHPTPVLSYVERLQVDSKFKEAIASRNQIVVYGASKQGKTALVSRYLPYKENIVVSLSPRTELIDIYASIIRQAGISLKAGSSDSSGREMSAGVATKFRALIPLFGSAEAKIEGKMKSDQGHTNEFEEVPFNLALPQDISELLKKTQLSKFIIIENFHYLSDEKQRAFAFDLRTYQELGVRFIILGVWRERNRMCQYNGDLLDRIEEIPVEPWDKADFVKVVNKGAKELNISFADKLIDECIASSFGSIGVYQELLKDMCSSAGVAEKQPELYEIQNEAFLKEAISNKTLEYSTRHERALEAIAAGNVAGATTGELKPLFLPYYLVKVVLGSGYDGIANGMGRNVLHEKIKSVHHRGEDVRSSDMSNLLYNLAELQSKKEITPPIIDFNRNSKLLEVVDSTFYFFMKNADLGEILSEIHNPLE